MCVIKKKKKKCNAMLCTDSSAYAQISSFPVSQATSKHSNQPHYINAAMNQPVRVYLNEGFITSHYDDTK